MADSETGTKKTAIKKSVKKAAPLKKAPVKKAPAKKTVAKKTAVKKSAVSNSASEKAPAKSDLYEEQLNKVIDSNNSLNKETLTTIQSIVEEMRKEHSVRDQQLTSLAQEVRQGFSSQSDVNKKQDLERDREMNKLYKTLQNAFHNAEESQSENEERSLLILKSLTESIQQDHEQTLKEVHEQERVQDKKYRYLTKVEEQRAGRNRWIAIPGMIIGIIAIVYMFYVVSIMEKAMTSMSNDMGKMQLSVGNMSTKMDGMSGDTHAMNSSMQQLTVNVENMGKDTNSMKTHMQQLSKDTTAMNGSLSQLKNNVSVITRDLGVMTRNVAPTMKGIRDIMPWSP